MTRKQIDASKEVRLWLKDIIIPCIGVYVLMPKETKEKIRTEVSGFKNKVFHR